MAGVAKQSRASFRSVDYIGPQIPPERIFRFDKLQLLRATPGLDLFLAHDGQFHRPVHLKPEEQSEIMAFVKSARPFALLPPTPRQVRRNALPEELRVGKKGVRR